jgi:pimeloyl-ACP methyl ester carboxylesterase
MKFKPVVLLLMFWALQVFAAEPDFAREGRLADEIVDVILDGDPEWLEADGREFLSIFTEAEDADTGVIILHGRGFHPDWADTVNPLRVGLVENGYTTLSLQMPVLAKEAKYYDYVPIFPYAHPRIDAGISFLRVNGYKKIVLLAHSCGVHMAMSWLRENGDRQIDAFIGLGMGATDYNQPMQQSFPLDQLSVPVLDLYGEGEYPAVIGMAPARMLAIEAAGNKLSAQVELADADHYFTDQDDALVEAVTQWLQSLGSL